MEPFMTAVRTLHVTPVRRDQFAANLIDGPAPGAFDLDQRDFGFFGGSRLLFTMGWFCKVRLNPVIVATCRTRGCIRLNN